MALQFQIVDDFTTALGVATVGLGFTCSLVYVGALAEGHAPLDGQAIDALRNL